ncbi:hypothetical protein HZC53_01745 [Candidatus Uhrbacteria bacterium]|nr:hypothetical protein [Candidatus Uhrbacteria bacterium]
MTYNLLVVGTFVAGIIMFAAFMFVIEDPRIPWLRRAARIALPLGGLLTVVGAIIVLRYGYLPSSPNEVGVRQDGIRYSEFTDATMCWQRNCILVAKNSELEGAVQPITDNPKVRHLKYKLEVEVVDPVAFARAVQLQPGASCPGEGPMKCQLDDAVLYEIYEFNNANSKELARFYNPYDKKQADELEKLMNVELTPPLAAKGINFKRLVSWSVE